MILRPGQRVAMPGGGVQVVSGRATLQAGFWWLAGGISAANCIAAYQPKGAASLAASYVNLANPGTYDAAPGTAPSWATGTGWTFNGSTQYLRTSVVPANDQSWSFIVRLANRVGNKCVAGVWNASAVGRGFAIWPYALNVYYDNGGEITTSPGITSGVLCVAGNKGYRDGTVESGTISAWTGTSVGDVMIGALHSRYTADGTAINFFAGDILALAIFNIALSGAQAAAVTSAMQAL